jgi:NO-binding membrane sensor protein with MHYT domain
MSMFTREQEQIGGLQRKEIVAAVAETTAIFTIFVVAFTGRDLYGDIVRQLLIGLSLTAGVLGTLAGLWVIARGLQIQTTRVPRLALGGAMAAMGIYTIIHVL